MPERPPPFTVHRSRFSQLDQLRMGHELRANGPIKLIRSTGLRIGPREAATDRGVVVLAMNRAAILDQEHATPIANTGPPFAPASPVDHVGAVSARDSVRLRVAQGNAEGAARGLVGTGKARKRRIHRFR